MKLLATLFPLLSVLTPVIAKSDVSDLTKDNFDDFIGKNPLALVEFFAPWCGHCQKLAPKYEKAATTLKGTAALAKVDCTVETDLCQKYEIQGFPTLKVFTSGQVSEYGGNREADGIVAFMKKMSEPKIKQLQGADLESLIEKEKLVVVGYFEKDFDLSVFTQVATTMFQTHTFVYTFEASDAEKAAVKAPAVVLYKQFDDRKAVYEKEINQEDLHKFLSAESIPVMGEIGPENYADYVGQGLPLAYFFYETDAHKKQGQDQIEAVAKEFKGKVSFVYISSKFEQHGQSLGCSGPFPWFTVQMAPKNIKYPLHAEITADSVKKHVSSVLDGSIQPFLKSEPVPESNTEPVKVVVGKSFDEIVKDTKKDVLLEVYAPWCGHCKKLAPIYEELGKALEPVTGIVISKLDGTTNDLPTDSGLEIQGFPTIVLYKAGDNQLVNYDGDRSFGDLVEFLKKNAVNGASIPEIEVPETKEERDEL